MGFQNKLIKSIMIKGQDTLPASFTAFIGHF